MNDLNGTALQALAAALAPYLVAEMAKVSGAANGNPTSQQGGGFGAQQNTGATFAGQAGGQGINPQGTQQMQQPVQQGGAQQQNMFGGNPNGQQAGGAAPQVTPDMIQQLITPLVQNDQIKQALTAQMQQMGINNLPDARPDQLAELYSRFQNVEQQARAAGLLGAPQGGTPSII